MASAPQPKGYPINPISYGDYLRCKRMESNFTQSDLATILGVYKSTIDKWERGIIKPNKYNKKQIINFLGYDPIKQTISI